MFILEQGKGIDGPWLLVCKCTDEAELEIKKTQLYKQTPLLKRELFFKDKSIVTDYGHHSHFLRQREIKE